MTRLLSKAGSKAKSPFTIKRVMVAVDGSANADRAAAAAIEIAKNNGAQLTILNVVPPQGAPAAEFANELSAYSAAAEDAGRKVVDAVANRASGVDDLKTAVVKKGTSTVHEIVKFAEEQDIDLIVVGTRGRGGFKKLLLGSVSSGVLSHAHCAVLVVR